MVEPEAAAQPPLVSSSKAMYLVSPAARLESVTGVAEPACHLAIAAVLVEVATVRPDIEPVNCATYL